MRNIFLVIITSLVFCSCSSSKVRNYRLEVVAEYPHDTTSYTQGLFFKDGQLYESTGLNGKSTFRVVDLKTGKALRKLDFDKKYFVEGSVIFDANLYVLTWENKVVFIYDAETLEYKSTHRYARQGWGLTTDGESLIASDGSANLYFMGPDLKLKERLFVTLNDRPVNWLNELEYINGRIWANVYTREEIVIINPRTGKVEGIVDCSGLLPRDLRGEYTDVLNGIAYNAEDGKIYLTGKNWPRMYEIRIVEI